MSKKAAVILSGCGYLDGSEIHETVLLFLAMKENNISYHCFTLDKPISKVMCHVTKTPVEGETRNILRESARVARGDVQDIAKLDPNKYDILCLPGGYGVATNLSDFSTSADHCSIDSQIKKVICTFHELKKPIIAICLAPVVVAKALKNFQIEMTLGENPKDLEILEKMGMQPKKCKVDEICVDQKNLVYSAPGYMAPPDIVGIYRANQKIMEKVC